MGSKPPSTWSRSRAGGLGILLGSMLETGSGVAAAVALASRVAPEQVHDLDAGWWAEAPSGVVYQPPWARSEDASPAGPL